MRGGDTIKLAVGLTLNLGNYQSMRVDVGLERKVESGDHLEKLFAETRDDLHKQLDNAVDEFVEHAEDIIKKQKGR